jgi:hypothetical protein
MRSLFMTIFTSFMAISSVDQTHLTAIALIDISATSNAQLASIKQKSGINWWAEMGDSMLVGGSAEGILATDVRLLKQWTQLSAADLAVITAGHRNELPEHIKIIATAGHTAIVTGLKARDEIHDHYKVEAFKANQIYVRADFRDISEANWTSTQESAALAAMDAVDPVRWYGDVGTLTNWNRHISSVDVVSARDWIKDQFEQLKPTATVLQKFNLFGRDAWNVIATFDAGPASDIYIIGGHYDSLSERVSQSAPGAEDNASGTAGVLELARVFAGLDHKATLIFITFSGEEEGLIGSKAFVRSLPAAERSRIKGVLNMDMIGYSQDDSLDVLLETSSDFRMLHDQFAAAAKLVEGLNVFTSYNPFGSDHMPFIDNNIPAILTIDNDWGDYPAYHRTADTIDKVSRDMGAAILKMNAGALAAMISH